MIFTAKSPSRYFLLSLSPNSHLIWIRIHFCLWKKRKASRIKLIVLYQVTLKRRSIFLALLRLVAYQIKLWTLGVFLLLIWHNHAFKLLYLVLHVVQFGLKNKNNNYKVFCWGEIQTWWAKPNPKKYESIATFLDLTRIFFAFLPCEPKIAEKC